MMFVVTTFKIYCHNNLKYVTQSCYTESPCYIFTCTLLMITNCFSTWLYQFIVLLPWWQMVKNLPVVQEIQVHSLGQEDPLEKGMATHSSILVWRIPWTEEVQSMGSWRGGHNRATNTHIFHTNSSRAQFYICKFFLNP